MYNARVKFGLKIESQPLGKNVRKPQGDCFDSHYI